MKDIFRLSNDEKYKTLIDEIQNRNLLPALTYWGTIEFNSIDEKRYYLASILMKLGKVDEAVFYAKSINDQYIKREAEKIVLEAYSKNGMIEEFADYFENSFDGELSYLGMMNYAFDFVKVFKYHQYVENEYIDSMLNRILMDSKGKCNENFTKDECKTYFINSVQYMSLYIDAIKESILFCDLEYKEGILSAESNMFGYENILRLLNPVILEEYPLIEASGDEKRFNELIYKFYSYVKENFNIIGNTEKDWLVYYMVLERVVDDELLIKEVYEGLDRFPKMISLFGDLAVYPLLCSYSKAMDFDETAAIKMEKVLLESGISNETVSNAIIYESVANVLSSKAKVAYKGACTLYNLAKQSEYEQNDAGPMSLAFYRILELESNTAIWEPIIKDISLQEVNNIYNSLSKTHKNYWSTIIRTINKMFEEDDAPGLMIGNLRYLMGSLKEPTDALANVFKERFISRLTEEGINAYNDGLIDEWYSEKNQTTFRNPPAHGKYLHFDAVERCKFYVENQIINMGKWFKDI